MLSFAATSCILWNIISSVGIVNLNKYLFVYQDYHYGTFITFAHLVTTAVAMWVCRAFKMFEPAKIPLVEVLKVSLPTSLSIVFMNMSLLFNSIGFYQLSKLMIIPCTVMVQKVYFNTQFTTEVLASLAVLTVGVGFATLSQISYLTVTGFVYAVLAVTTTSLVSIFAGNKMKEFGINSMQLLEKSAPVSAVILAIFIPLMDNIGLSPYIPTLSTTKVSIFDFKYDSAVVGVILATCVLAVSVNLTTFLVVQYTSAVSFLVVGHLKTILVLVLGFMFFAQPMSARVLFGTVVAVTGVVAYSYFKHVQAAPQASPQPRTTSPTPSSSRA